MSAIIGLGRDRKAGQNLTGRHWRGLAAALGLVLAGGPAALAEDATTATNQITMPATDPYLWLEDIHSPKAMDWVKAQNARATAVLQADPDYQANYSAVLAVLDATDRIPYGSLEHEFVYNFWQDAKSPKGIWRRTPIAEYAQAHPQWENLLDVDMLAAKEKENWVWKGVENAPSLMRCLVSLSRGGGDAVVVREFDPISRTFFTNGFALPEAKSSITYLDEDTVLISTDFGPGSLTKSGYPRIVKRWHRGEPLAAAQTVYAGQVEDVRVNGLVFWSVNGTVALIQRDITLFTQEYYYLPPGGQPQKLPVPVGAELVGEQKGSLLFKLREDWTTPAGKKIGRGALVAYSVPAFALGRTVEPAVLYAPDAASSVEVVAAGPDVVYANINRHVTGTIHAFRVAADGTWQDTPLALPAGGATHIVAVNAWGPEAQFSFQSYTQPPTFYADTGSNAPKAIKALPARFDASGLLTEQFFATSRDGTKVPYFVTRPKQLHGPAPTVLYGYGGFEISLTPTYVPNYGLLWLNRGGIFVVANIRGGGEYGPQWHQAALLAKRQRAYDDFQAVAEDLIRRGLTTAKKLGIMGGSNGGLLVTATMVERPDLFGAVVCQVPLIDMIRFSQIGAGASWVGEYGDPADPAARAWILKYSPYQNVRADAAMPPVLFVTATSDDRVTPVHARKMAARMEAQGHEVLFYENTDGGHAAAADHRQSAEMWAQSFVFLKQKLGLAAKP